MISASKILSLLFALLVAIAPQRAEAAATCDDDRLPRVDTYRYEIPTYYGRGVIKASMTCRAETAPYFGPRGEGEATLITQTYSRLEIDMLEGWTRMFLAAPDGSWQQIPGIKRPRREAPRATVDPRAAIMPSISRTLIRDINESLPAQLPLVRIEEGENDLCLSYASDYPFIIRARTCSSGEVATEAAYAAGILSVPEARRIAGKAWTKRYTKLDSSEAAARMRLTQVISGKASEFEYVFRFYNERGEAGLAVTVNGVSGKARLVMRP